MFNEYSQNIKINAVSGSICKSTPKSFFVRNNFKKDYDTQYLFSKLNPRVIIWKRYPDFSHEVEDMIEEEIPVVILQIVAFGEQYVAEVIRKEDYDEIVNASNQAWFCNTDNFAIICVIFVSNKGKNLWLFGRNTCIFIE